MKYRPVSSGKREEIMTDFESPIDNSIIGIIGAGNMARSLVSGLIESGFKPNRILVSDRNEEKRALFSEQFKVATRHSNIDIANSADILVLAVKPKDMRALTQEIKEAIQKRKPLIVSIVTGIQTEHFEDWLGSHIPIVRAMPNTPALLRVGATGLYANTRVSEEQKNSAESLMRAVGITVWVNHEHDLDIVAALSGSGPAYFYLVMEALQQSAESMGLPKKISQLLTVQTALGAARLALESDSDLAELRQHVTAKGGITEKALDVLEDGEIRLLFKKAVMAARDRSVEIGHQLNDKK